MSPIQGYNGGVAHMYVGLSPYAGLYHPFGIFARLESQEIGCG